MSDEQNENLQKIADLRSRTTIARRAYELARSELEAALAFEIRRSSRGVWGDDAIVDQVAREEAARA